MTEDYRMLSALLAVECYAAGYGRAEVLGDKAKAAWFVGESRRVLVEHGLVVEQRVPELLRALNAVLDGRAGALATTPPYAGELDGLLDGLEVLAVTWGKARSKRFRRNTARVALGVLLTPGVIGVFNGAGALALFQLLCRRWERRLAASDVRAVREGTFDWSHEPSLAAARAMVLRQARCTPQGAADA